MAHALALAGRGLGNVWPNPAVGCILVRDGRIAGRGWTQPGGRPHAETEALARAGAGAQGATCYTTLEPCAHEGKTGPCADALAEAGIARAVVALEDPDARVAGRGIARLEAAGIEVARGCMENEARALNAGFLARVEKGRPHLTLKLASSLDGRIATHSGDSRWITGEAARARAHLLRARHDAVMVGAASARADDPALTCRLPGMAGASPVRVVIDGSARLPATHALIAGAGTAPTWIVSTEALAGTAGTPAIATPASTSSRWRRTRPAARSSPPRSKRWPNADSPASWWKAAAASRLPCCAPAWWTGSSGSGRPAPSAATGFRRLPRSAWNAPGRWRASSASPRRLWVTTCWTPWSRRLRAHRMFSGIVTDVGRVRAVAEAGGGGRRLEIATAYDTGGIALGASIACSGPCLTVVEKGPGWFAVDVSGETASRTTLGDWRAGTRVNLERALSLGDEIGGHLVTGHIDGVGPVEGTEPEGDSLRLTVRCPAPLSRFVASKGSIALDGVSLTVNEVEGDVFGVNLIPHTLACTTFEASASGRRLNLEVDLIARYLARLHTGQ